MMMDHLKLLIRWIVCMMVLIKKMINLKMFVIRLNKIAKYIRITTTRINLTKT